MNNITELRQFLGDTLKGLKDGSINIEKAKAISDLGQVIINSAKVEVDYLKTANVKHATDFINAGHTRALESKESRAEWERPEAKYSNKKH